jgi:hypothetical protein
MRFMLMDRVDPNKDESQMPSEQQMADMGKFMEEHQDVLHSGEGLHATSAGVRVRLSGGQASVTRGPFTDTISNFAIIEAESEEAAIEHATNWLKIWGEGETEIRRVVEDEDLPT